MTYDVIMKKDRVRISDLVDEFPCSPSEISADPSLVYERNAEHGILESEF